MLVASESGDYALIGHLLPSYAVNGLQHPTTIPARSEYGYSYNGLAKVDFKINKKNDFSFTISSAREQVAPVGSQVKDYYEVGPIHVSNYAASLNSTLTPDYRTNCWLRKLFSSGLHRLQHQLRFGRRWLNFYNGYNLPGAPRINITGFDSLA